MHHNMPKHILTHRASAVLVTLLALESGCSKFPIPAGGNDFGNTSVTASAPSRAYMSQRNPQAAASS